MSKSEQFGAIQRLPLVVGISGGTLLLLNRFFTSSLTGSQSRSDALGIILSALLILISLLWQQVQPRSPEQVVLIGEEGFELADELTDAAKTELAWASHLLLTNTVTKTLLVWYEGQTLLRRGILSHNSEIKLGAIVQRVIDKQKPIYLVDLKLYPGRFEFDYLPENTQGIICQPLGAEGVLVLGANAPRSYTNQDEAWIAGIAEKLTVTLKQTRPLAAKKT